MAAWRRSGQTARTYAARVGVSAASLHRWSSLLRGRETSAGRLVEVASDAGEAAWAWELELATGTLRSRAALEATTARAIVEALARVGRR